MGLVRKSFEVVADDLTKRIENHLLKPGDRLPTIDQLSQDFGVGKSTIREALSQLKARGLIESKQGEGTFVMANAKAALSKIPTIVSGNPKELFQLLEARQLIESGCIQKAASARDEADLLRLSDLLDKMKQALDNEELSRLYDIQFHMSLAAATKNPFLTQIMDSMSDALNHTIRDSRSLWLYRGQNQTKDLYEDHLSIFQAVKTQDASLAKQRIDAHLEHVRQALSEYVSSSPN